MLDPVPEDSDVAVNENWTHHKIRTEKTVRPTGWTNSLCIRCDRCTPVVEVDPSHRRSQVSATMPLSVFALVSHRNYWQESCHQRTAQEKYAPPLLPLWAGSPRPTVRQAGVCPG